MNTTLFELLHSLSRQSNWSDSLITFFAESFGWLVIASVLILPFTVLRPQRQNASGNTGAQPSARVFTYPLLALAAAVIARLGVTQLIRHFYFRPRPFAVLDDLTPLFYHPATATFPSGHASFFFALATIIFLWNRKVGIVYFLFAAAISLSRVIAGIHWPVDIAAGAVVGIGTGIA
ncbi:MAG: phosphatase PAP2 family protein, partial [Patescibacteria group bacterium]|nr:phosphatase PAP2 family protein [Patescibacteria group bacterium]